MVVQDGFKGQAGDNMANRCPCRLTTSSGVVITQCHDCVIRREQSRCRISFCAEGTIVDTKNEEDRSVISQSTCTSLVVGGITWVD